MKNKKLIITIGGQPGTGKSIMAYLLKEFLKEKGFEVATVEDLDFPTEKDLDKHISSKNLTEITKAIAEKTEITVKTVQLNRVPAE